MLAFALLGTAGAAGVGLSRGIPAPAIHDEFSYLLAADTFSSGRLTNPPHPHWQHFETFHVIHQPTYASKYPPAQGLVLAAGQWATGRPITGVWLSVGAMSAAIAWMLLVWLHPAWAVVAAAFCTAHIGWVSYWGQSYWGGAVAATGGALAFGALGRLRDQPRLAHGVLLGTGIGLMAASRPFEGAVATVCLVVTLLGWWVTQQRAQRASIFRALLPAATLVVAIVGWLAYYNWRVTESPLTLPYQVHQTQYAAAPPLLLMKPGSARTYRHRELERYWTEFSTERHLRLREYRTLLVSIPAKILGTLFLLLGPGAIALAGFPGLFQRRYWVLMWPLMLVLLASLLSKASNPHYIAPVLGILYLAFGAGLWSLHRTARRRRFASLAICVIVLFAIYIPYKQETRVSAQRRFAEQRATILSQLESRPDRSLVFVLYAPDHDYFQEWVYNRADIDGAKVVWARSMSDERDRQLVGYFADRTAWTLSVDGDLTLRPFLITK